MTFWTVLWVLWLALFLAIEIPAWRNTERGDTLSEHVWRWLGRGRPMTRSVRWRRILFLAFAAWLLVHLTTGWV